MIQGGTYRKYFLHQVTNHPAMLHDDDDNKIFECVSVENAYGDFRKNVKKGGFIFRLVNYTYVVNDNTNADAMKMLQGVFLIAKQHSDRKNGADGEYAAMDAAEKIVDEFLEKMVADSKNGHPLFYHSLNTPKEIHVSPRENTGDGYSGWMVSFRFSNHFRNCISHEDAPDWEDGGLTPHEL